MMRALGCVALLFACVATVPAQDGRHDVAAGNATLRGEYQQHVQALEAGSAGSRVARRIELALWCQQQGLHAEMTQQAQAVLATDPDHAVAHRLLGHEFKDGRWLTHDEAMRTRGYVQHRGQWLRRYEVAALEYREQQARQRARLERTLNQSLARLTSSSAKTRANALLELEARAARLEWPALGAFAHQQKAIYDAAWREYALLATVRLQSSQLQSLVPFTTSLGVGSPVQLQLPQLQSISVSTTVGLPAGSGR